MSWRDDLRKVTLANGRRVIGASFRGVPFFVESSERSGGRRIVTHEFPLRDDPYVEDLGRRARVFSVEGYVVGADYVRQRDALLSALEDQSGAGELVHPYHGSVRAICASVSVRDTRADGGVATFQIEFHEAPSAPTAPVEEPDLAEQVSEAATEAVTATEAELTESYDVSGQPSWATASLAEELESLSDELSEALASLDLDTQDAARVAAEVTILGAQAAALVRTPADLVAAVMSPLEALRDAAADARRRILQSLLDVYATIGQPEAPGTTATRELERANQTALADSLRRLLVIEAARIAPLVEYETLEDATSDAGAVAELLEEQAASASNEAYPALVQLRARLLRAVPGDAALARIVTVERPVPVPSLVLSYQLYGTVDEEADLIARNGASHPGVMAGTLKVRSHV